MTLKRSIRWSSAFADFGRRRALKSDGPGRRRAHPTRLGCESLEIRALLTTGVSSVLDLPTLIAIENATSTLTREDDSVALTVDTLGLEPGTYNLDWVIFNDPEYCAGECLMDDFDNADVQVSRLRAAEAVVDESGQANFFARLSENDTANALWGPGMLDARTAEVHYLIQSQATEANAQGGIHYDEQTDITLEPVLELPGLAPIEGSMSRLTREDNAVAMTVNAVGLEPGTYNLDWVIFNNPEYCAGECLMDDFDNADVQVSRLRAAEAVVDESGQANFFARLSENDTANALWGPGMLDARTAEVHYLIQSQANEANVQGGIHYDPQTDITLESVLEIAPGLPFIDGTMSRLTRDDDAVAMTVNTVGLEPGTYNLDWVIFNNPEYCAGECLMDDFDSEDVQVSRLRAAEVEVGESGEADFFARLSENDVASALWGSGMLNARTAEVHYLIQNQATETNVQGGIHFDPHSDLDYAPVLDFSTELLPIAGATSRLTRYDDAVALSVDASGLEPGPYTVWIVAFNHSEYCAGDCFPADFGHEKIAASVLYGTARTVDENGEGHFTARLRENDTTDALFGPGLLDASRAEIHYIIRPGEASEAPNVGLDQLLQNAQQAGIHWAPNPIVLGDSNGDGHFDQADITHVLQAGKYNTGQPADFSEGDWNDDGVFNQFDLIDTLVAGSYQGGIPFAKQLQGLDDQGNFVWEGSGTFQGVDVDVKTALPIDPEPGFTQHERFRSLTQFTASVTGPQSGAAVDVALQGLINMATGEIDLYGTVVASDIPSFAEGSRVGLKANFTGALENVEGSLRPTNPRL